MADIGGKDIHASEARHHTDVTRLDGNIFIKLDIVGVWINTMAPGSEYVTYDALVGFVAGDNLSSGKVFAKLTHEHAEFAGGNIHCSEILPFPSPWITEIPTFRQDLCLNTLILRTGSDDGLWRKVLTGLFH